MAIYTGLTPIEALDRWYQIQHTPDGQLTPEERADKYGNMIGLAKENPQAWDVVRKGIEDPKDQDYFFAYDPASGAFQRREHKGYWTHPESWAQLGFGIGLGAVGIINPAGAAGPASSSLSSLNYGANLTPEAAAGGTTSVVSGSVGGTLPSVQTAGAATLPNVAPSGAVSGGVGTFGGSSAAGLIGETTTPAERIKKFLGAAGRGVGASATAQENNKLARGNAQVDAATEVQRAYVQDAAIEQQQRQEAIRDMFRDSYMSTGQHSPYNPNPPQYSQAYRTAAGNLAQQGGQVLAQPRTYSTANIPNPKALFPDPATAFQEGAYSKVANWLVPGLEIASEIPEPVYRKILSWIS